MIKPTKSWGTLLLLCTGNSKQCHWWNTPLHTGGPFALPSSCSSLTRSIALSEIQESTHIRAADCIGERWQPSCSYSSSNWQRNLASTDTCQNPNRSVLWSSSPSKYKYYNTSTLVTFSPNFEHYTSVFSCFFFNHIRPSFCLIEVNFFCSCSYIILCLHFTSSCVSDQPSA